ncbi:hypothetical protein Droror1_Dr00021144 [Drosera rotundifolia]
MDPYPYSSVANRTRSKTPSMPTRGLNNRYKYNLPSARENTRQHATNVAYSSSRMFASKEISDEHVDDDDDSSSRGGIRVTDDSIECLSTPTRGSLVSTEVICLSSEDSDCHEAVEVPPETNRVKVEISDDEYERMAAKYCNNNLDSNLRGKEMLERLDELFSSSSSDSNDDDPDDNDYGVGISDSVVGETLVESENSSSFADESDEESADGSEATLSMSIEKRSSSAKRKKNSTKEVASSSEKIAKKQIKKTGNVKTSADSSFYRKSKKHKEKELCRKRKVRDSNAFPATGNEIKKKARKGCPRADSIKKPADDVEIMCLDDEDEHVLGDDSRANTISIKAKEKEVSHKRKSHDKADNSNSRFFDKAKAGHSTPRLPDKAKTSKGCSPAESVAQPQDRSRMSISVTADKVKVSEGNSRTESILNPKDRSKTSISVTGNKDKGKAREDHARAKFNKHRKDHCKTRNPVKRNADKAKAREDCARAEFKKHLKVHSKMRSVPVTANADKAKAREDRARAEFNKRHKDHSNTRVAVTSNTDKVKVSEGNSRAESILKPKDRRKTSIHVTGNKAKGKAREDCGRAEFNKHPKVHSKTSVREECARAELNKHPKVHSKTSVPVTANAYKAKAREDCARAELNKHPKDRSRSTVHETGNGDKAKASEGCLQAESIAHPKDQSSTSSPVTGNAAEVRASNIYSQAKSSVQPADDDPMCAEDEVKHEADWEDQSDGVLEKSGENVIKSEKKVKSRYALDQGDYDAFKVLPELFAVIQATLEDLSRNGEDQAALCRKGNHCLILDEEIGLLCSYCRFISQEIKDIIPSLDATEAKSKTNCSIWELKPEITSSMYPHQKEGFEFLWRNIAGSSNLEDLKKDNFCGDPGGCIISHTPGTGKTRLTIVFLMTYMVVFPESKPVVLAPAGMLLSWEDEFKKWNVDIPFHNLNNLDFSGKEDKIALSIFFAKSSRLRGKQDLIRMVKLYSWKKDASILGVSYNLYEKLTWDKQDKKRRNTNGVAPDDAKMREDVQRILLELPWILVLDEGHTPRNKTSSIWQAISQVKTRKRIILSGTPFQNNLVELFNTMSIVRPTMAETLSKNKRYHEILAAKKRVGLSLDQYLSVHGDMAEEAEIAMLKREMAPFVHVHKGSILQERLPGLVDRVLVLDPPEIQKQLIKRIETNKNTFEFEHRVALISTHPALYKNINFSKNEEPILNPNALDAIRLDHSEGVKTRFIVELVHLANALKEKVLVFSQYIYPLDLIRDQIASKFGWSEGREILRMQGKLEQRCRQTLIGTFNDPDSQAKVLLASTKAWSEGINLVGASRVVLLDVVWNPSVERQAISRAYRLGQKKLVYTYHLIASGTTEWEKYCRQAEKDRISQLLFSSANKKSAAAVSEDRILEEMISHEKLKDMIVSCHQRNSDLLGSAFRSGLGK